MSDLAGWKSIPLGAVITEPGNSRERFTGDWRTFKPVINQDKCTRCLRCWVFCPEPAISIVDRQHESPSGRVWKNTLEINYDYCKGCGICVEECEPKAIDFIEEVK
jgi:pyruvate ferredoxin oxidoreductase delta subunit